MEVYYGFNKNGTTIIYAPYYFAGMSLNGGGFGFRFRFDLGFLNRLAKSRLNLEDLAKKGWEIQRVDVNYLCLDRILNSVYENDLDKANEIAYEMIEIIEDSAVRSYLKDSGYDDEYFGMDTEEEYREDNWWNLGLKPPFLKEDADWGQED